MSHSFPNSRKNSNSDYPKSSLTFISEYQKLMEASGDDKQEQRMEPINWAPEHSDALRENLARGLSFSVSVKAINLKFSTAYSRNAAIGRAKRMGLTREDRPKSQLSAKPPSLQRIVEPRSTEHRMPAFHWPAPVFERVEPTKLRAAAPFPDRTGVWRLPLSLRRR